MTPAYGPTTTEATGDFDIPFDPIGEGKPRNRPSPEQDTGTSGTRTMGNGWYEDAGGTSENVEPTCRRSAARVATPEAESQRPGFDEDESHLTYRQWYAIHQSDALPEYVRSALAYCQKIEVTNVPGEDFKSPVFSFTRLLRGHPLLEGLGPADAWQLVEAVCEPVLGSLWEEGFKEMAVDDPRDEFMTLWFMVKHVPGDRPLSAAIRAAAEFRLACDLSPVELRNRTDGWNRLLSVAGWMQRLMGDADIYLPCDDPELIAFVGLKKTTLATTRKILADVDRFLVKTRSGKGKGRGEQSCDHFRVRIDRLTWPQEACGVRKAAA